jgi:manganese-dependent inorganic pyrophosphatase
MPLYVIGHKNPDTDSVTAAIVAAAIYDGIPAVAGELNKETRYLLERFGVETPDLLPSGERKVILVDHNSREEGPTDLKSEELVAIIDHHKLGAPISGSPIEVTIRPYGCSATVLVDIAHGRGFSFDAKQASLLIGAILSDTLKFTSPTTTDNDRNAVQFLNIIAKLDLEELASSMFAAKSDISDVATADLIKTDYKVFDLAGKKVGIGVHETVNAATLRARKDEILSLLGEIKQKDELDYIYFATVDILKNHSELFLVSDDEHNAAQATWGGVPEGNVLFLPGVVSRKKQITPPLEEHLATKTK